MTAKKQTKSRTSKSKINKKISAPRWVIAVVLLIVVGTGAFLVYQSFAYSYKTGYYGSRVTCTNGECYLDQVGQGNQDGKWCSRSIAISADGRRAGFKCR